MTDLSTANQRQVGGQHYKKEVEHWDWVEAQGMGYLEAAATKYITRYREKDGRVGLEKAVHYIDKLIEYSMLNERKNRVTKLDKDLTNRFFISNGLGGPTMLVCWILLTWENSDDLNEARTILKGIIKVEYETIR